MQSTVYVHLPPLRHIKLLGLVSRYLDILHSAVASAYSFVRDKIHKFVRHANEKYNGLNIFERAYYENSLVSFTDASFEGTASGSSVAGFLVTFAGVPVSWRTSKLPLISVSTCECEMQAAQEGHVGTQNVKTLLEEIMGIEFKITLAIDNKPCVQLLESIGAVAWRTRQLKIKKAGLSSFTLE